MKEYFHSLGFNDAQVFMASSIMRSCLDYIGTTGCDVEKTLKYLERLQKHANNNQEATKYRPKRSGIIAMFDHLKRLAADKTTPSSSDDRGPLPAIADE